MSEQSNRVVRIDGRDRRPWALESRDNLLRAAISEIAERGYEHARLVDIANRADLTVGSIYTWFKDKRDLFSAALQYSIANQQKTNAELLHKLRSTKSLGTDTTPWTLAVAALNPFDPDSAQPSESQKLLLEAMKMAWRDDEMRGIIQPLLVTFFEQYVDVVESAQETGDIHKNVDTEILARVLMAMPIGLAFLNLAALEAPRQERYIQIFTAISRAARLDTDT